MDLHRPHGEKIAGVSAILLFAFMFLDWFGMESSEDSFNLFSVSRSAWEALDYIPIVLLIAISHSLRDSAACCLQASRTDQRGDSDPWRHLGSADPLPAQLRLYGNRVGDVTYEGTLQLPIFLALAAACGIAYGGLRAMREE